MIKVVEGNLLDAHEDIIGHQVNCMGKMNSGVAKQIREKYPKVYSEYMKYVSRNSSLGKCQLVDCEDGKTVANLFGQFKYGYDGSQYTNINALTNALVDLKVKAKNDGKSVALPYKIASDRGGAKWDDVYKIIEKVFEDYEVTLYRLESK